ncbi:MAG: NADH-ubiquinone oxidoreductase-F iron-sulfur binding region domain-containing protein [Thermoguttaceae bacterium]|jgi:NADH:ubiquinone oxidoreductase subunit F (NADH-binding)/(2Fe-2S) ferredoxin
MSEPIRNLAGLERTASAGLATLYPQRLKILIGAASCGVAVGAREVEAAARRTVEKLKLDAVVARTGCIGFCAREPLLDLLLPGGPRVCYADMTPEKAAALLQAYSAGGELKPEWALGRFPSEPHVSTGAVHAYPPAAAQLQSVPEWSSLDFYRRQQKVILRNCGSIDPMALEEAVARGTYRGALRALTEMTPEQVIEEMVQSGLRGRGGAAFPTGVKWRLARQAVADLKYVVCNADEGEPGAYMDRTVLEGDPHAILEGMLVGGYAIGAREGFLYVRSEYPLAIEILRHAIDEAEGRGLLGDDIFGSGWSFRVSVRRGAGAYICGEETALIESLEGHSGEPRTRPPYPVTAGLWGKPTVVNNVKTWASVAPILTRGPAWYAGMGTKRTAGTTIFSLEGAVKNAGLVEVPFGISLRELIYEIGGGINGDRSLKALQAGGASRGCIPASMLDLAIDTEDRPGATIMIGTGGIIALDDRACMVDMARFLVGFFLEESCGKCVPCREGTKQMYRILQRICAGDGSAADLPLLERLAQTVKSAAVCGMGGMAPGALLTTLGHFRDEFEAHIGRRHCPAGVCAMDAAKQALSPALARS